MRKNILRLSKIDSGESLSALLREEKNWVMVRVKKKKRTIRERSTKVKDLPWDGKYLLLACADDIYLGVLMKISSKDKSPRSHLIRVGKLFAEEQE